MSKPSPTKTDLHDDGHYVRTAIVLDRDAEDGSIDLVTPNGVLIARVNFFTSREDDPERWLAVDVCDVNDLFTEKRVLVFDGGQRRELSTEGTVCSVDMRRKVGTSA